MFCFHYLVLHPQKTRFNTYSILCCHALLPQEPHSIYVLFLLYYFTSTKIKFNTWFIFCFHTSTITTLHLFFFLLCHVFVTLSYVDKKKTTLDTLHFVVLACLRTNNTMCTMARSGKYNHGNFIQKTINLYPTSMCDGLYNTLPFRPMPN
jgi:hypothetical protein